MLTENQIQQFKKEGVLIIKNFFTQDEIKDWKKEVLEYFENPISDEDWVNTLRKIQSSQFRLKDDPIPTFHLKMKELYDCFSDTIMWHGENEVVVRSPEIDAEWLGARAPHLDFPVYDNIRTLINSVFYMSDVTAFGGPFMYWPGSHLISWDYFKETPKNYMAQGALSQDMIFAEIKKLVSNEAIPFFGEAGDLMIWHSLILHSASVNKSDSARIALIGRWGKKLNSDENHFDFDLDIWDYLDIRKLD
jgi:Phytanoyl-CoA dioxygenase (PhyH)